jgi:hypothetical protein
LHLQCFASINTAKKIYRAPSGLKISGASSPGLRNANSALLSLGYQYLALRAEFIVFNFVNVF